MLRPFHSLTLSALVLALPIQAQIAFGGKPHGLQKENLALPAPPVAKMPAVNVDALMAEDAANLTAGIKGPWRFGFNHAVDLNTGNSGRWDLLPNGDRIWRIVLHSPGAFSINFEFHAFIVPEGGEVFVYNEAGEWLGAFTGESAGGLTVLGVDLLAGDKVTVEYLEPSARAGEGHLQIGQVTHAYRDVLGLAKGFGDSGPCNNNVICPEGDDWRDQIRSVAMIVAGGGGMCTGQLINNCAEDGIPYFLTARHCTQGSNVGTWVFRFNWDSPTCTPTTNAPTTQTVSGSTLLVQNAGSDVALLQLNTPPPSGYNVFFTGWDKSGTAPTSSTAIHHPSGDMKKISFDNDAAVSGTFNGAQCWRIMAWDDGTTEPASSGSGLWDQNGRLIGQLFGGSASCTSITSDYYGKFNVSYPFLEPWLGNCGNTLDGYPASVPLALDASVQSIQNVPASLCNENVINPQVTIKNLGSTTLTSLTLLYNLNGAPDQSLPWTGSLATGATAAVNLPAITAGNGSQMLTVRCTAPNGGTDLNPGNDQKTRSFNVAFPGQTITLRITLDGYGSETTWQLAQDGGGILFTGGPYSDGAGGTVVTSDWCLGNACYTFTIFDSYGDGICCDYGNGSYLIEDAFGTDLATSNGQFTDSQTRNFCLTNTGVTDLPSPGALAIWPNPGDGLFTLRWEGTLTAQAIVTDALGRQVLVQPLNTPHGQSTLDLRALADGVYNVSVQDGTRRMSQRVVVKR
ncbi:MAG: trypsin-like peptidase domain-containing protein [Flavobacteriales bacterium]|nr:trypsin-like peptidase domain-containing protein [Flavobacteriales bacterium]